MTDPDNSWAEIHDLAFSYMNADIAFYVEEARRAGGPVLELGCGAGRVTVPIAEAGVDIVGVEASAEMLDVARRRALQLDENADSISFVQAEMSGFTQAVDSRFKLAIIPFRGFLSLLTVEDQGRVLRNIFRCLAPGGKLILDIAVPNLDTLALDEDVAYHLRDVTDPHSGRKFVLWRQGSYDDYTQVESVRLIVEEMDEQGAMRSRILRNWQMRYSYRWEMQHLLRLSGYEVLSLFGDFDRSPFDDTSANMIWVTGARS